MTPLLGALVLGAGAIGVLLLWDSRAPHGRSVARPSRLGIMLRGAGVSRLTVGGFVGACGVCGVLAGVIALAGTGLLLMGLLAVPLGFSVPVMLLRRRVKVRHKELRASWPEAVDALVSGVRAGMALPEAVSDLAQRGPEPLRGAFAGFAATYRATGSFERALGVVESSLSDPVADRVVIALRLAREVGGTDLSRVLTGLSGFLREDARTRGEIEARYSWTINAARIAVAAPWVTLVLLSTRQETVEAYSTPTGMLVLAISAGLSLVAYRVMMRFAALPMPARLASC